MPRRRVLMLAYRFPPASNAIASRRPEGLYRHLPEFGWEPHVITTQNELGLPNVTAVADRSLAGKRGGIAFHQADASRSGGFLARLRGIAKRFAKQFPAGRDAYARWSCDVVAETLSPEYQEGIELVWATLSPLSLAYAAGTLAAHLDVPFVLDLRDPPDEGLGGIDSPWFTRALGKASAVTVAAPSCITPLVEQHCKAPLLTLTGAWRSKPQHPIPSERFHVVHAGTWHSSYVAEPLFAAVRQLAGESKEFAQKARLMFVGKGSNSVEQAAGYSETSSLVETLPLMSYEGIAALMASSSVLLLARSSFGYKSQAITGKIFEYAPYEIPLLSIGGMDDLHAMLVRWLGGTWTNDVAAIKDSLRAAFLQWQASGVAHAPRNPDALAYLTQQRMAAETATVLHAVVERRDVPIRTEAPWRL